MSTSLATVLTVFAICSWSKGTTQELMPALRPVPRYTVSDVKAFNPAALSLLNVVLARTARANKSGLFAGTAGPHGFLYDKGKWVDIGTLGGPGSNTRAMNSRGQVVGLSGGYTPNVTALQFRPFLWQNGTLLDIGPAGIFRGYASGEANGINDRGQVVGQMSEIGFFWDSGKFTPLPGFRVAWAINNRGQIIGEIWQPPHASETIPADHAGLWERGRLRPLEIGTWFGSYAVDINNQGQIAGCVVPPKGGFGRNSYSNGGDGPHVLADVPSRAAWWDTDSPARDTHGRSQLHTSDSIGVMHVLGTLGGANSVARAINDWGWIVGASDISKPSETGNIIVRAFLYANGHMYNLNNLIPKDSGWILEEANGINNFGEIIGIGYRKGFHQPQPFLLTPDQTRMAVQYKKASNTSATERSGE